MSEIDRSVRVARLPHASDLPLPSYGTAGAAGVDLLACVSEPILLPPNEVRLIGTGLRVALPPGYELQIRPRSGLAAKHGVTVLNAPGTVDEDYRGEVAVLLINHGPGDFVITRGMRIAQAVLAPVVRILWDEVSELDDTARGLSGFGSTGLSSR